MGRKKTNKRQREVKHRLDQFPCKLQNKSFNTFVFLQSKKSIFKRHLLSSFFSYAVTTAAIANFIDSKSIQLIYTLHVTFVLYVTLKKTLSVATN